MTGLRPIGFGLTDVGRKRASNEDAYGFDDALGIYVVADGMGGHAAGEVASRESVDAVIGMIRRDAELIHQAAQTEDGWPQVQRLLEAAVQSATYLVFALAESDPEQRGMGTTVSALLVAGNCAFTGQVGDSRIYLVRDGDTRQLTEDHTLVAWQVKQGIISEAEAERSPHRNVITRAVGSRDYVQVDTRRFEIREGDRFLLCSDGLHGYLDEREIAPIMMSGGKSATEHFIATANQRGGRDNITAIVVEIANASTT